VSSTDLSVVIASYNARDVIAECLRSLRDQDTDRRYEVIVVDSSRDGTSDLVARDFPDVHLISFSERRYCGGARNAGIACARGRIIAFIDADCTVDRGWVEAVVRSHDHEVGAIGGAIANGEPCNCVAWAAYFCEFSQWMPGTPAGWMADVAGASMSYKRELLQSVGPFVEAGYCSDTEFHWRMAEQGERIWFDPTVTVVHHSQSHLGRLLRHELHHGRSFARMRSKARRFSPWRRRAYACGGVLLPALMLARIAHRALRGRAYLLRLILAWPLLTAAVTCWSLGESLGYLQGAHSGPDA
jgi:GT2 family glycosyltransferase